MTGQQSSQFQDLNQRLLKRQEENHPHEQKPLLNSQNCCNRRKDYSSSRLESKNYGEKYNAKYRSPGQKPQFPPYYRLDTHIIRVKRNSIHPFPQKHRIYQELKIAYSILATILPPLIPPIILPIQRETRGALSEVHWIYGTVISPPPDQSLSHFSEKHEVPFLKCIGGPFSISITHDFSERTIPLEIPPTRK